VLEAWAHRRRVVAAAARQSGVLLADAGGRASGDHLAKLSNGGVVLAALTTLQEASLPLGQPLPRIRNDLVACIWGQLAIANNPCRNQ
jgi:hypothetical protein